MKIENKKIKQNDLIYKKFVSNVLYVVFSKKNLIIIITYYYNIKFLCIGLFLTKPFNKVVTTLERELPIG